MTIKVNFLSYTLFFLICFIIGAFILNPGTYIQSTYSGIILWAQCVLPALFPFLFLTKILTSLKVVEKIAKIGQPITKRIFNCPGITNYVFLLSIISGYPVGAKLTSELYKNKIISSTEATRMCSFCSTSGPIFVVGTVGATMFLSVKIGFIILFAHIIGAFLNGLIFRFYRKNEKNIKINTNFNQKTQNILSDTIYDSVISVLIVGGYIALFYLLIDILTNYGIINFFDSALSFLFNIFSVSPQNAYGVVSGIIEITRGCFELSKVSDNFWTVIFATGLISWGGISTHLQSLTFLKQCNVKTSVYLLIKTTHCFLSMLVCFLLLLILK